MQPRTREILRTALPWLAGLALLVLGALSFRSIADREVRAERAMSDELAERLHESVDRFESGLLVELDALIDAASRGDPAIVEADARRRLAWFDAIYAWRTTSADGRTEVRFVHPAARDPALAPDVACVTRARREASLDPAPVAEAIRDACVREPRSTRAYAATEAAQILREAGRADAALAALDVPDLDDGAPLRAYPDVGVARRVSRRLLRADLLDSLGRRDEAARTRATTVSEIADLSAPDLEGALFLVPGVLETLGAERASLAEPLARAEQRLAAWREILQTALRASPTAASEVARFTYDQYSDTPYLLYSRRAADGGVAVQLRQEALVEAFLADGGFLDEVQIRDVGGRRVAGAATGQPSLVQVAFDDTLRHLRATLTLEGIAARGGDGARWERLPLFGTITICLVLGVAAIAMQQRANRRYQQLLVRQRDFTARVTHELKTPLAGIRVMAENLAAGTFRDARQREEMAERIMAEADRLTERVNEVLQAAREREVPEPRPFDLEEVLLDLVDAWAPRYEQAGIALTVDLAATDPVVGDARAVRDAIACLLDNALKYRREDVDSEVLLNVVQEGRWAEIEVVDNGLGVPVGQRQSVFERFVRVEGPNRGKSGGHGLGLAQVREIALEHGGTVRCEDGLDGGARFVLRLPVTPGAEVRD